MSGKLTGLALEADLPSAHAKLVLLKLTDAAEPDGTRVFPSIATMARVAKCSDRHAHRIVNKFRASGLLVLVRQGGSGPGDPNEYRIDIGLLQRLAVDGWKATFGGRDDDGGEGPKGDSMESGLVAEKGDTESPMAKGDIGRPKGDISAPKGDSMESYNPSLDPSFRPSERGGPERVEESGTLPPTEKIPDQALLDRLIEMHPQSAHDSVVATEAEWRRLTREERRDATSRFPEWLASKGARKAIAGLPVYLAEKRWTRLAVQAPLPAEISGRVDAFSRAWWWLFFAYVRQHGVDLVDQRSAIAADLRRRVSAAMAFGAPWMVNPARRGDIDAAAKAMPAIPKDGDVASGWKTWCRERGTEMPIPDKVDWIFVPSAEVPAGGDDYAAVAGGPTP